ncbi:transcription factor MYB98-like [Mercurialis annua]|uniref:transcription factor MYB98-like n=1 Tax=Mercurialis annua TaxID=3986 RepID=UPI0021605971|nr:transcription factor MYB98-like [Mercurialis annua]
MFLSDDYLNKPGFFFEAASSSSSKATNFLQDFQSFDQFHANGSSLNPMSMVQTGSNFETFDVFPFGSSSTDMEFHDYECKPFAAGGGGGGHYSQVMDNFQRNNNLFDHHYMIMGSNNIHQAHFQEIKPLNFVIPDEVSCTVTANQYNSKQDQYHRKRGGGGGVNKSNARVLPSTRRTWKARKKNNVVKGQWTSDEDRLLTQLVEQYGIRKWSHIAQMLPGRIGKQCRERWHNHLRPDIKKEIWSEEEDKVLIEAHAEIGNKWAEIAKKLPGRTENSIKNHWNATKRRQYSKRKCRSKYPRGSLLQDYIKSLNLDSCPTARSSYSTSHPKNQDQNHVVSSFNHQFNQNDDKLLVPMSNFGLPDFEFDEKVMFQEGCSFESLLDEKSFEMMDHVAAVMEDVTPLMANFEVKKELDLVEMITQANM